MLNTELPKHLFDQFRDADSPIEDMTTLNKGCPSMSQLVLVAPLDQRFGKGFIKYHEIKIDRVSIGEFKVTLNIAGIGESLAISVSGDGSSILASIGGGSHFLNLKLAATQAAVKMLEVATRIIHEPEFKMTEEAKSLLQALFGPD